MKLGIFSSCKEATRLASEQLDHPLPIHKRVLLKIHLRMCAHCLSFEKQIAALKDMIGKHQLPEDQLPSPYTSSLSQKMKERLKLSLGKK